MNLLIWVPVIYYRDTFTRWTDEKQINIWKYSNGYIVLDHMSGNFRILSVGTVLVAGCMLVLVFFTGCTAVSDTNTGKQSTVLPPPSQTTIRTNDISQSREALLQVIGSDTDVTFKETQETIEGTYHKFSTPDKTIYYVNSATGNIDRVETRINYTNDVRLSLKDAEAIAQRYVDKFSMNLNRSGLTIADSGLLDHGISKEYKVVFRKTVDGVLVPDSAMVLIDPSNGALVSYLSIYQDVTVSLKPQLSKEEALKIAVSQYPGIKVLSQDAVLEAANVPDNGQKLLWMITLKGELDDHTMNGGIIGIDAIDGSVLFNYGYI